MAFAIFSNPLCPSGTEFGLMVSGLSKFARRQDVKMACFCAFDLYLTGFQKVTTDNEKKTRNNYRSRFINRFPVALMEDNMPYCWWVLDGYIEKFTKKVIQDYKDENINIETLELIHFLISNIVDSEKCRSLQHLREVGDEEFKSIENEKDAKKVFLNILKKYNGYDENIIESCIKVYDLRKKPIILSAALSYVRYKYVGVKKIKKYNNFKKLLKSYLEDPTPDWKSFQFLFDKHVSPSISKKYGVNPVKGWKGFVENEEKVCWDKTPNHIKTNPFFKELKEKYWEKRMYQ